jgi:hypothetical protein
MFPIQVREAQEVSQRVAAPPFTMKEAEGVAAELGIGV